MKEEDWKMKEENPAVHNYKDLVVWQKSISLVKIVYQLTKELPASERFVLTDQIRRAVVSIPSNIAEGQKRLNRKETVQFTGITLGSTAEVETQLVIMHQLHGTDTEEANLLVEEISKMLSGLIRSLR